MSDDPIDRRWVAHDPLATPEAVSHEPSPFPGATIDAREVMREDWRQRLTRNLARRSDGRWEPLSRVT